MRPSITADYEQVEKLTEDIEDREKLLADLKKYNEARRDKVRKNSTQFVQFRMASIFVLCRTERPCMHFRHVSTMAK